MGATKHKQAHLECKVLRTEGAETAFFGLFVCLSKKSVSVLKIIKPRSCSV